MIKKLLQVVHKIFSEEKSIMSRHAEGEICPVCGKKMYSKQCIWQVKSGGKMHRKCWGKFAEGRVCAIKKLHKGELDA